MRRVLITGAAVVLAASALSGCYLDDPGRPYKDEPLVTAGTQRAGRPYATGATVKVPAATMKADRVLTARTARAGIPAARATGSAKPATAKVTGKAPTSP